MIEGNGSNDGFFGASAAMRPNTFENFYRKNFDKIFKL